MLVGIEVVGIACAREHSCCRVQLNHLAGSIGELNNDFLTHLSIGELSGFDSQGVVPCYCVGSFPQIGC